jgi:hypothetical protein
LIVEEVEEEIPTYVIDLLLVAYCLLLAVKASLQSEGCCLLSAVLHVSKCCACSQLPSCFLLLAACWDPDQEGKGRREQGKGKENMAGTGFASGTGTSELKKNKKEEVPRTA